MFTKILTLILFAILLAGCTSNHSAGTNSTADTTTMPTTEELTSAASVDIPDATDFHDYGSIEFGNIQVSDSINLRFFAGTFPGATEYLGLEGNPIHSEFILADFLSEFDSLVEFCEFNHQYHSGHDKLIFVFDGDVENFQWIEMYHEPRFDETTGFERNFIFVGDAIFSVDVLEANQPFVTTFSWPWGYVHPDRGISFIDEYGNTRIFAIHKDHHGPIDCYVVPEAWTFWEFIN